MEKFTNEEMIKILKKVLHHEGLQCDYYAERDREAIIFRLSLREQEEYDYSICRYNRILEVINWLKNGVFPDDPSSKNPISIDLYCKEYLSSQTHLFEYSRDFLNYFECKMFEEWKQKLKETQVREL